MYGDEQLATINRGRGPFLHYLNFCGMMNGQNELKKYTDWHTHRVRMPYLAKRNLYSDFLF